MTDESYPYDVALSFAGEDRAHAEALATLLKRQGVRVFYDMDEKAELWGRDLYAHLSDVYHHQARFCVMFLSEHYARKAWTNHERKAAQARAFREHRDYILPVRLDETTIPGVLPTIGHLSWPPETAESVAEAVLAKLAADAGPGTRGPSPVTNQAGSAAATGAGRPSPSAATTGRGETAARSLTGRTGRAGQARADARTAASPLGGEISALRDRFFRLFREHRVPATVIPALLSDFGITLSALEDEGRLVDLLTEPLIAYVADLFRVEPAWLRGSFPSIMRPGSIPRWYKTPAAFCARVADLYTTSPWVQVHFIRSARTPSRLGEMLGRTPIDIGAIIEREHHPAAGVAFSTYERWEEQSWEYYKTRWFYKSLLLFCDQACDRYGLWYSGETIAPDAFTRLAEGTILPAEVLTSHIRGSWEPMEYVHEDHPKARDIDEVPHVRTVFDTWKLGACLAAERWGRQPLVL